MTKEELKNLISEKSIREGVKAYAFDLIDNLQTEDMFSITWEDLFQGMRIEEYASEILNLDLKEKCKRIYGSKRKRFSQRDKDGASEFEKEDLRFAAKWIFSVLDKNGVLESGWVRLGDLKRNKDWKAAEVLVYGALYDIHSNEKYFRPETGGYSLFAREKGANYLERIERLVTDFCPARILG